MNIQEALRDIVKQCAVSNVEVIKVTGSAIETKVQTFDAEKTLFIEGYTSEPVPEFKGEFGITNLKMLSGLLGFTNYQTDDAKIAVRVREVNNASMPDQFEFKGKGSKSVFKLMDIQHVPTQATIANIPWDVSLDEISKSKITEFQQFAGLYAEIDKHFSVTCVDDAIVVTFGVEASSTHSGSMTLADGVSNGFKGTMVFPVDKFLMLMKITQNSKSSKLMFSSKGLLGVEAVTDHGSYKYFLRQSVRG